MQQTTNYQLNQWEQSDRILMEDFNRDNLIIENGFQALKATLAAEGQALSAETAAREALGQRVALQTIRTVTTSAPASYVEISLADISWGAWRAVHLLVTPQMSGGAIMGVYFNGFIKDLIQTTGGQNRMWVSFYPRYEPAAPASGLVLGSGPKLFGFSTPYQQFTKVGLSHPEGTVDIPAGTKVQIMGEM